MSAINKIMLLILTVIPFIFIFIFMILVFAIPLKEQVQGSFLDAPIMLTGQIVFVIWSICLVLIYLLLISKNKTLPYDRKLLWSILLLVGGHIAMVAYWYNHLWKEDLQMSTG